MSRAIIGDLAAGFGAARAMTLMMSITSMTPVVAPAAGAFLAGELSWRWVLGCIAIVNVVQMAAVVLVIPETLPEAGRRPRLNFGDLATWLPSPGVGRSAATAWCSSSRPAR